MKKPVMQRPMFANGGQVERSGGILAGFDEMENDYEDRRPENLEIIANNLRGDIRSMDERYLELAQIVGEAAFDTPEEVIAYLQAQLAQKQPAAPTPAPVAGGIAALGAPQPAAPDQGIMQGFEEPAPEEGMEGQPPMPEQGMEGQPPMPEQGMPIQMADGGIVYRANGSSPIGERALQKLAEDMYRFRLPPLPAMGDTPEGRRQLGFMRYLPQGTIPGASEVPPRSVPIPRVAVQQTAPMTGFLSPEAANFLQSSAARGPQALPQKISPGLRAATAVSEAARNVVPFARDVGRTLMGTPYGRAAGALGLTGAAMLPLMGGREEPPAAPGQRYSQVPGLDEQGRYRPVPIEEEQQQQATAFDYLGDSGTPFTSAPTNEDIERMIGLTPPAGAPAAEAEETTPAGRIQAGAAARRGEAEEGEGPKDFKQRVQERMAIYKEVLGDDENARKAQALFLLAEAALNVGAAKGTSNAERILKGLKGLPAGLSAIATEKSKQDMAIASAAISSVESQMAQESKDSTKLLMKIADLNAKNADVNTMAQYLVETQHFSPEKAQQVAKLSKAGAIKTNDAGEMVDLTGRVISSPYRLVDGDVGYLPADGSLPFVSVGKSSLVPATAKDRPALASEMSNNQSMVNAIERVMQMPSFETAFGPVARVQSGLTSVLTPFFGANVPFTNLAKDVQLNVAMELRNELIQLNARNTSRPSVWEQKQIEKFIGDPKAILNSPEEFFGILNNFRVKAINRTNEIEHQLNGSPLKQLEYIPMGTAKEPLQAKDARYLQEFFRLRPNGSIYLQLPNEKSPRKFTAQEWYKQTGQQ